MKNNNKIIIILLSIILVGAIGVGGFFGYNYYQKQKQIENTRFITSLDNRKVFSGSSIVEVANNVLYNAKWTQTKVSGNDYNVECNGTLDNSNVRMVWTVTDKGKGNMPDINKDIKIYKGSKLVSADFATSIIFLNYYTNSGKQIADDDMKKFYNTFKIFKSVDNNLDLKNIDKDYFVKYFTDEKNAKNFANSFLTKIADRDLSQEQQTEIFGRALTDYDVQQINDLTEVQRKGLIDDFANTLIQSVKSAKWFNK